MGYTFEIATRVQKARSRCENGLHIDTIVAALLRPEET